MRVSRVVSALAWSCSPRPAAHAPQRRALGGDRSWRGADLCATRAGPMRNALVLPLLSVLAIGCGGAIEPEPNVVDVPEGELLPDIIGTQRSAAIYQEAVM